MGFFFVMTYIIGYDNSSIMLRSLYTPPGIGFERQFLIIIINRVRQIETADFSGEYSWKHNANLNRLCKDVTFESIFCM